MKVWGTGSTTATGRGSGIAPEGIGMDVGVVILPCGVVIVISVVVVLIAGSFSRVFSKLSKPGP